MSTQFKCLLIVLATLLVCSYAVDLSELGPLNVKEHHMPIIQKVDNEVLLAPFMNKSTKVLFKAWHFVYQKDYNYNSELGIKKYKTFKANYKKMIEHNRESRSWFMGLNHLSDMTDDDVREYYNIKPFNIEDVSRNLRKANGYRIDDANESSVEDYPTCDHRPAMRPIRNQGQCGSCWAFTTQAVLEGNFSIQHEKLADWFSTQISVDCDKGNNGCGGGWYNNAFKFFTTTSLVYEKGYPYTAKAADCRYKPGMDGDTGVKVEGYTEFKKGGDQAVFEKMIKAGPVAVAVDANSEWFRYKSGIFDKPCASGVNHAVVLVGYGVEKGDECNKGGSYFIIRNSWGEGWGEKGHMKIKNDDKESCNVEKFGYQVTTFKMCKKNEC